MMRNLVKVIVIAFIVFVGAAASAEQQAADSACKQVCQNIPNVKSIIVNADSILIEFDTISGGFQVVYRRDKDNIVVPLERKSIFTLRTGENIGWGDGDHVSASIVLDEIKDKIASITVTETLIPPATHKNLERNKSCKCKIDKSYQSSEN